MTEEMKNHLESITAYITAAKSAQNVFEKLQNTQSALSAMNTAIDAYIQKKVR